MARPKPKGRTTLSGLGQQHRVNRERLLRALVDGSPCDLCGRPRFRDPLMNFDGKPLHADHELPRAIAGPRQLATRLVHATCNLAAGGRLRAAIAGERLSEAIEPERGRLAFPWP
jgi:hypothetical protein